MWHDHLLKKKKKEGPTLKLEVQYNFNINMVVFNSFKIKNKSLYKDPIPNDLKSHLVYKFTCAGCSSSYIGTTYCHFNP